ncbi:MAG TPA: Hpt domain-containing protein, partial [Rhodocyclaceae bacterium]|nr:Hpt domain-containing protein [Rhodocyclaceae bacterium]
EMNGLEAARIIRNGGMAGISVQNPNVMMVALTADASIENQQDCLAAGMDAYLTKPIEEQQLHAIIASAIARQIERGAALDPLVDNVPVPTAPKAAAKTTGLMLRGMVDDDMASELMPVFVSTISGALLEVDEAIKRKDFRRLVELFHSLKGSIGYFSDDALYQQAASLEAAAKARNAEIIGKTFPPLRETLAAFVQENR